MSRIVIFGPDGGGKSTLAKALHPKVIKSYATPIKDIVHKEKGKEPYSRLDKEMNFREDYIRVGERAKELYGEDVWANAMKFDEDCMVIDDGRFYVELRNLPNDVITVYCNIMGKDESSCEVAATACDYILDDFESYDAFIKAFDMEHEEEEPETQKWNATGIFALVIFIFGVLGMLFTIGVILYGLWTLLTLII